MTDKRIILQILVLTALDKRMDYKPFDYLPPPEIEKSQLQPGKRFRVPFGKNRTLLGILLKVTDTTEIPDEKLKAAISILDTMPILPEDTLQLLEWASRYYHHFIGGVVTTALPALLNQGEPAELSALKGWKLTEAGLTTNPDTLKNRQGTLLRLLQQHPQGITHRQVLQEIPASTPILRKLVDKGWVTEHIVIPHSKETTLLASPALELNPTQTTAVTQVCQHLHEFYPCLLDGVTGSGKTEVYLQIIQKVIENDQQALVLVPEINLTPQMLSRFQTRFTVPIVVLHSTLSDTERLQAWLLARDGHAPIVIGTRSAVWVPLARPGVFIVDEEHDLSYKQQDSFSYSARDVAVVRAQRAKVPVILGSATPSLDSLYNAQQRRYQHLILPERAGIAVHPTFQVIDMRQQPTAIRIAKPLQVAIQQCLAQRQQILLFINRRGYAPALACHQCNWVATCDNCDAYLTYHGVNQSLRCHHCGASRPKDTQCPQCHNLDLHLLGQGTQRIEEMLQKLFPTAHILRIDSDSTRRKQAMNQLLQQIHSGEADILVGTQMLAKGHHFPKVTLVGVINIDGGLYGVDFRSSERMGQLLIQVAGRAGRAEDPGRVIIQTYHPDHPLLKKLIQEGYHAFAEAALIERLQGEFPPFTRLVLLRAHAKRAQQALDFLKTAKIHAQQFNNITVNLWGPVAAPMEKRASWYRAQLLLQSTQRDELQRFLYQWLPTLPASSNEVRWSIDVDPQDLS